MRWLWKISDEWEKQRAAGGGGRWVCIEYLAKTTCLMDLEIVAAMKRWNARSLDRSMLGCWPSGGWWRPPFQPTWKVFTILSFELRFKLNFVQVWVEKSTNAVNSLQFSWPTHATRVPSKIANRHDIAKVQSAS